MLRFLDPASWGSDSNPDATALSPGADDAPRIVSLSPTPPVTSCDDSSSPKKRRYSSDDTDRTPTQDQPTKRARPDALLSDAEVQSPACDAASRIPLDSAREVITHHFGLDILTKHNEIRLIDQELAKCQVALEQLRRCHLIPYPVNRLTPEEMLNTSAGTGRALQTLYGAKVPLWAPPFGVVDGPYARHYSRWLIPDPSFDGVVPEPRFAVDACAPVPNTEGRTTRNSGVETGTRGRSSRCSTGNKLQSLPNAQVPPKEKPAYCTVKRADGQTVKLVCLDCERIDFSSTQGFINHCRIAHKREFKSHEEAAVACGKPLDAPTPTVVQAAVPTFTALPSTSSGLVHPLAQPTITDDEAWKALGARIKESIKLQEEGKLSTVSHVAVGNWSSPAPPKAAAPAARSFRGSLQTPNLSQYMASRNFDGDLAELVADAKTPVSFEDMTPEDDAEPMIMSMDGACDDAPSPRPSTMMRMPARTTAGQVHQPISQESEARPASCVPHMPFIPPPNAAKGMMAKPRPNHILSDEDIDMEDANLSPNTLMGNIAPSLVSDDGEYSDEGSSMSDANDGMDSDSMSDVAEITLDDEHDARPLRRGSSGVSGTVPLRMDDPKHVTFLDHVQANAQERRPHKA
jgi:ADA HAT complex component 1